MSEIQCVFIFLLLYYYLYLLLFMYTVGDKSNEIQPNCSFFPFKDTC
jgi:hypothetical protein